MNKPTKLSDVTMKDFSMLAQRNTVASAFLQFFLEGHCTSEQMLIATALCLTAENEILFANLAAYHNKFGSLPDPTFDPTAHIAAFRP